MADIVDQVKTLSLKVDHIKASIYQAVHKEYSDLYPSTQQLELMKLLKPLLKDINKLEEKFETEVKPNLVSATSQHKDLVTEYDQTKDVTNLLQILCNCHRELVLCKGCSPKKFVECAKYLQETKKFLVSLTPNLSCDISCDVKIVKVLRREYINQHKKTLSDISDMWKSLVIWNVSTSASWNSIDGHLKTSLKINVIPQDINMVDLIKAMDILNVLEEKLKLFSHKIFIYFIKPLSKFHLLVPNVQNIEGAFDVLTILKKHQKLLPQTIKSVLIYQRILEVFQFICTTLFHDINPSEENEIDPIKLIGSFIWDDMSDFLINEHLASDVPSTKSQMEKYEPIYEETVKFEAALMETGLIPVGTNKLSKYVSDASIQFSNKICQDILSQAHEIMLHDIHNLVVPCFSRAAICPGPDGQVLSKQIKNMFTNLEAIEQDFFQTVIYFDYPICHISDAVQKLLDFIYTNMVKATESPYPIASQIYHCCRDIFELYVNVVPVYHKEALKLPQLAAVHYNNCMYLAHHCTTLGHQFRASLPEELQNAISTFIDYVPVLRKCGTTCFLSQLQLQQQELLTMLEACNNFTECTSKNGMGVIEKTFNQIVLHLTRLSKQWNDVLPGNIFKHSLAILINAVLENILASIFRMEDISAEEAGNLHVSLGMLIKRTADIILENFRCDKFKASADGDTSIYDHIRSWVKFNHLISILDSSLLEISNLWDNGDGKLASCMNEGEVRSLIRALFQNTDQRSKVLAKIKHKSERS